MKKWTISILVLLMVVLVAYQNCVMKESINESDGVNSYTLPPDFKTVENYSYESLSVDTWVLDLVDEEISYGGQIFCPDTDLIVSVKEILQTSKVCEKRPAEGEITCMAIPNPYAQINFTGGSVSLDTEETCGRLTDLCGEASGHLRAILDELSLWLKTATPCP